MVVCAISICYNKSGIHVGINGFVRMICSDCYHTYFVGGKSLPELRVRNPQETLGDDKFDHK